MRIVVAVLAGLIVGTFTTAGTAKADPYRWCADYGMQGGGTNCYFLTLQQCQAAISGMGCFCRENGFYDGRPVGSSAPPAHRSRSQARD